MKKIIAWWWMICVPVLAFAQDTHIVKNVSYQPGQKLFVGLTETELGAPIRFQVTDDQGKPVTGALVTFELIEKPGKAKGDKLALKAVETDSQGIAENSFTLGDAAGDYIIIARTAKMAGDTPHVVVRAQRTMWWLFLAIGLFGGLGIFLYGMGLGSGGLQKIAGDRLRGILSALTSNRFLGLLVGIVVTAIVQSSSATSVMVVGLVSTALMTLQQAIGVLMGAHIGTTITVQLIAFNVSDYALLLVGGGFLITIMTKRKFYIYLGEIILGFGFIFFGMAVMSQAIGPLKSMPAFIAWLIEFGKSPLLGILASTLFTAVIQSSGATIGLCVVLASEGLLSLQSAMPLVFGANIGTCVTPILSAIGASTNGRRTAVAHTMFSIIGVVIFTPFLIPFENMTVNITQWMGSDSIPRQIANGHMIFNLMTAALLISFVPLTAKLITKLIPEKAEGEEFKPKYLNNAYLETPDIALQQAQLEEGRLVDIVKQMYGEALNLYKPDNEERLAKVRELLKNANLLENAIRRYLTRLSQKSISLSQSKQLMRVLLTIDDLRHISERIGLALAEQSERFVDNKWKFSPEGESDLNQFYTLIKGRLDKTLDALMKEDKLVAQEIIDTKHSISEQEVKLRAAHMMRMAKGGEDTLNSSNSHLDLLAILKRIDSFNVKMSHEIVEQFQF
ncbi:Na/Pi symporter [bacterium]|nr:Na/Pi symporter [bacterium]